MKLSIIILNYKTLGLVKQLLKNLRVKPFSISHEIIVVDNNSSDDTPRVIKELFPYVRVIELRKNIGFAGGNNVAIREAKGEYILILNSDVAATRDAIENLCAFMDSHGSVGIVGPKLINPDGSTQMSSLRWPKFFTPFCRRTFFGKLSIGKKELSRYLMLDFDHKSNAYVPWLLGACLMVRSNCIKTVGLMDERFFLYLDDTDWCRRFWENGFSVMYLPAVELVHYHERLSASESWFRALWNRTSYIHIMSFIKYFLKYQRKPLPNIPTGAALT